MMSKPEVGILLGVVLVVALLVIGITGKPVPPQPVEHFDRQALPVEEIELHDRFLQLQDHHLDMIDTAHIYPDVVILKMQPWLYLGSDDTCQAAGQLMLAITSLGFDVYIVPDATGFVPSAKNPVTHEWAQVLAEGY